MTPQSLRDQAVTALLVCGFAPADIAALARSDWDELADVLPDTARRPLAAYLMTRRDPDPAMFLSRYRQRLSRRQVERIRAEQEAA